ADLDELKKKGVNIVRTPDSVLEAQLKAWDKVIAAQSADAKTGAFFAKVIASQKAWVKRSAGYMQANNVPTTMAYKHFFG
ncbi:MAG TPA: C4-dicarboxylate ABC transporter, partial [Hyphomicrobiaceae bacterium]|nr:C4-dicarboxylate ABC transporter [Hyphomicrobiaceae bacterium]